MVHKSLANMHKKGKRKKSFINKQKHSTYFFDRNIISSESFKNSENFNVFSRNFFLMPAHVFPPKKKIDYNST